MSDFDKFFGDKLNEEAEYPNQGKNWNALSNRLDAFAAGTGTGASYALFWKIAAAGLLLVSAYLVWQVQDVRKENQALRDQIAVLQTPAPETPVAGAPGVSAEESLAEELPPVAPRQEPGLSALPQAAPGLLHGNTPGHDRLFEQTDHRSNGRSAKNIAETPRNSDTRTTGISQNKSEASAYTPTNTPSPTPPTATSTVSSNTPETEKRHQEDKQPGSEPFNKPEGSSPDKADPMAAGRKDPPGTGGTDTPGAVDPAAVTDMAAINRQIVSPLPGILPAPLEGPKTAPRLPENARINAPVAQQETLVIRPHRDTRHWLRAGVELVNMQPKPAVSGISALRGAGANLEFSPLRNLWITASMDWTGFKVRTTKYLPAAYYPDKQPLNYGPDHELVQIDGAPKHQQLTAGLRYVVPLPFKIRPSVRVAHSWVRCAPGIFSFEFEEDGHGPGPGPWPPKDHEFIVKQPDAFWLNNIWRFGGGLEYQYADWVFSVGMDYVKSNAAPRPSFDAMLTQIGVQYQF